jgi:hypothetical protein
MCRLDLISIWLTSTINNTCLLSTENLIMFVALFCIEQRLVYLIDIVTITWRLLKKLNKVNLKCRKDRATKESRHNLCIKVLFLLICITVNYWCLFAVAFSTNLNINWICVCYCVLLYVINTFGVNPMQKLA